MKSNITLLFLFVIVQFANASQNLVFKNLGVRDGLSGANVSCFIQDYNGFLWIGTNNGLDRFDGYNFINYRFNISDSNSLTNNEILSLFEDNSQTLWIGTVGGLERYNRKRDNFLFYYLPDGYYSIKSIYQDNRGRIWIGSMGNGLYYFNEKANKVEKYNYKPLNKASINAISEDNLGNLWISTEYSGIYILNSKTEEIKDVEKIVESPISFKNKKIRSIVFSKDGSTYVGTYGDGMYVIDNQFKTISFTNFGSRNELISSIYCDTKNNLWIADDGNGIFIFNLTTGQTSHYIKNDADKYSLSTNAIWTIYEDKSHIIWIGSYNGGINFTHNPDNLSLHIINNSDFPPLNNNISSVLVDNNLNTWVGTDGNGLFLLEKNKLKNITPHPQNNLNYKSVLSLFQSKDDKIYSGYYMGGLVEMDQNGRALKYFFNTSNDDPNTSNDIRCITEDRTGKIWVGSNRFGVYQLNEQTGTFKNYKTNREQPSKGIAYDFVRSIFQDSKGFVWIGTCNGISRYNPRTNSFINLYSDRKSNRNLTGNFVACILESTKGYLYFGTNLGLRKLTTPVWSEKYSQDSLNENSEVFSLKNYTTTSGLPDEIVNSLIEDNNHTIWVGTNNGLCMFDPEKETFKNIKISEKNESFIFNSNACAKSKNGTLYFGTNGGVVIFHPDSLEPDNSEAIVRITDIKINFGSYKKHINADDDTSNINPALLKLIELKSNNKAITFEFSSLEYNRPKQIQYKYTLEGFDDKWNQTDALRRYATYTNLNPGEYLFKVKATNVGGSWAEHVTEIKIIVYPPFWKNWWFRILIIILTISSILLYIRLKTRSIEKRKRTLEILVDKRTKELLIEREKQRMQELENKELFIKQKELEADNLTSERELMRLRNEKLESEIELQNAEVMRKNAELASLAAQFSQKIEFLGKIKTKIKALVDSIDQKNNPLFTNLLNEIDKDNNLEKEWEQFEIHFNQVNIDFLSKLKEKYPQLSSHDLRLCGYLRMNLSTKEIATLFNVSTRGVEKSRSRLKKKLGLSVDESVSDIILKI